MKVLSDNRGQSTLEFALITAGFIGLVIGLGALWHAFEIGLFVEHAISWSGWRCLPLLA